MESVGRISYRHRNSFCPHRRPSLPRIGKRPVFRLIPPVRQICVTPTETGENDRGSSGIRLAHEFGGLSTPLFNKLFTSFGRVLVGERACSAGLQCRVRAADNLGDAMKKKILIVDDDPVMSFVCQRLLNKHDYETELAPDGAAGLERLSVFQPDAVLLDLMMPKVDGTGFLQRLRALDAYRQLPVIVLTNAAVPTLVEQASKAGATRVLDKSKFNPVAIIELLRGLLLGGAPTAVNTMSHGEPWKG